MCLSHVWYYLSGYCVLYGTWVLDGSDVYIICNTNWFIKISLEFIKWLAYKDFMLKDTKLLAQLPWPSRKQFTIFISSISNLVLLTCSILSANTDPLICVSSVFWKELNKCFLYFFLKSLFFAMLGILSTPLFCWLKWTALCKLSKSCPLLTTILPLTRYLKSVYRQSTCWYLKQNASNFCSNSLTLPIRIMWYLQLDRKHILSSWRTIQYSSLTIFVS